MPQLKQTTIATTLHKQERLYSKKEIDFVFEKGQALYQYPIKVMYSVQVNDTSLQSAAMFVVPKRNFKRAHDRNLLKRRMREAYRQLKTDFQQKYSASSVRITICFLYTAKKEEEYSKINLSIKSLLEKIKVE